MQKILVLCAALALSACGGGSGPVSPGSIPVSQSESTGSGASTPLVNMNTAGKTIDLAFDAYGVAVDAVDALITAKVIIPGSPRALALRSASMSARKWLVAARAAQNAGNSRSYGEAIINAQHAIAQFRAALK